MGVTAFLAALWGPSLLALGIGFFVSRSYYVQIYRDLEKNSLAVLMFAMTAIPVGILHTVFHNTWNTLPQIIVSLLGWGTLLKGIVLAIAPGFADRAADGWANLKLVPLAGALLLLVGAYLTWFAYF